MDQERNWRVHSDLSGKEWIPAEAMGREEGEWIFGVPRRVYFFTPWGHLIVGARTQGWLPILGFMPYRGWWGRLMWWPIVWLPKNHRNHRYLVTKYPQLYFKDPDGLD